MAIQLNDNIRINAPKPLDFRYLAPDNAPFASWELANQANIAAYRHIGLTVLINGVEYWYKSGIQDENLVLKNEIQTLDTILGQGNTSPKSMSVGNLTISGNLISANGLRILNSTYLAFRNAADTVFLNILGLNSTNQVMIGSQENLATAINFFSTGSSVASMLLTAVGRLQLGQGTPDVSFNISHTDAFGLPVGSTAQRPALRAGLFRYNSTLGRPEYSTATSWTPLTENINGVVTTAASISVAIDVRTVLCNNTAPITITLPSGDPVNYDREVIVKRIGIADITISGMVPGEPFIIDSPNGCLTFRSVQGNWYCVARV